MEVGAGRGYWANQLSWAGLAVAAYEIEPPDKLENGSFPRAEGQEDVWYPVEAVDSLSFDSRSGHVLFLCLPPGWGSPMASDALTEFERAGGDRLIYIGEPKGGKTGNDAFFDALSDRWTLETDDSRSLPDPSRCGTRLRRTPSVAPGTPGPDSDGRQRSCHGAGWTGQGPVPAAMITELLHADAKA